MKKYFTDTNFKNNCVRLLLLLSSVVVVFNVETFAILRRNGPNGAVHSSRVTLERKNVI